MTDTTAEFDRELEVCERLARAAGALVSRYHGTDLKVDRKAGDEPVTVADREASQLIVAGLTEAFPADVVISEEKSDDLARLTARRVWYIDPIDGTKDFIRGEDGFCVMIGLAIEHRPAMGVVYGPAGDRLFTGAPGKGAWMTRPGHAAVPINTSDVSDLADAQLVASKSHRDETIDRVKESLGIRNEHNIGSVGLKLALIAMGERDLYVNPSSKCSSWDTCGPAAILAHAGGRMTDLHGDPLRYDVPQMHHAQGLIASNGRIHDQAVAKLAELFPRK